VTASDTAQRPRKALNDWLTARASAWAALDQRVRQLQRGGNVDVEEALQAASDYRRIGRDLSLAQQLGAPPSTTSFLARQYAGLHQVLTRPAEIYGLLALTYFILCFGLSRWAFWLERRLARRDPTVPAVVTPP